MKILGSNKKAINQYNHTVRRFKERHGLDITKDQYVSLCAQIRANKARFVSKASNRLSFWWVMFKGNEYPVLYDSNRKTIVTVLQPEWLHFDNNLLS